MHGAGYVEAIMGQVRLVGLVGNDKKVKKVNNLTKYKKYEYYSKRACTSDFGLAW